MAAPRLIVIGADKGGVGKSFVARALADLMPAARLVDAGLTLRRFYPDCLVIDPGKTDDQMKLFGDVMPDVTIVDVDAGKLSPLMISMKRLGLLEDATKGTLDLEVIQVLGPTTQSIDEIVSVAAQLDNAHHRTVKNRVSNDSQFFAFDESLFNAMDVRSLGFFPHLDDRAAEAIDARRQTFSSFAADATNHLVLRREVTAWKADVRKVLAPVTREVPQSQPKTET